MTFGLTAKYNKGKKVYRQYENIIWADLRVGDYVKIETREKVPADVVVLCVSEKTPHCQGMCYVETKSLDGETNLKLKNALPITYNRITGDEASIALYLQQIQGHIEMEHPNKLIDRYVCFFTHQCNVIIVAN